MSSSMRWLAFLLWLACPASIAFAQWGQLPDNTLVCDPVENQWVFAVVGDGSGGALVFTHEDIALTLCETLRAQRLTASGTVASGWPVACGAELEHPCNLLSIGPPAAVADGSGGAFFGWTSRPFPADVFVQMVDGTGSTQWMAGGVSVSGAASELSLRQLLPDGDGGVFVAFVSNTPRPYLQRLSASGGVALPWPSTGVSPTQYLGNYPRIVSDAQGGVFVAFADIRNGSGYDLFVNRIGPSASVAGGWPADGIAMSVAPGTEASQGIEGIPDGSGGAIFVWTDTRNNATTAVDLYAQRVTAGASIAAGWPSDGLPVCTAAGDQLNLAVESDGAGGAFFAWQDYRDGPNARRVYVQHAGADGAIWPGWPVDGLPVCSGDRHNAPRLVTDAQGGVWVFWSSSQEYGIHLSHFDAAGVAPPSSSWPSLEPCITLTGELASTEEQVDRPYATSDGAGGAIVAWSQGRNTNWNVYAQRIHANGGVSSVTPLGGGGGLILGRPTPNPSSSLTTVSFGNTAGCASKVDVFDAAGRRIRSLPTPAATGASWIEWDGRNTDGVAVASGVYYLRVECGGKSEMQKVSILR